MINTLAAVIWDQSPILLELGSFQIRWYGLLFAGAFMLGYYFMASFFRREGIPQKELDRLSIYTILSVLIGARLGHVLFYQPDYYFAHPAEIIQVWKGGLASHGAAIAIVIGLALYMRKSTVPSFLWLMDRIVIPTAIGGAFVRLGNLMNSEIYGHPTGLPWGFKFVRDTDPEMLVDGMVVARHPTQIYEALGYVIIFVIVLSIYRRRGAATPRGLIFGLFLMLLFGVRFMVEFFKENQVEFENGLPLNLGQLLSIPFIIVGAVLFFRALKNGPPSPAEQLTHHEPAPPHTASN